VGAGEIDLRLPLVPGSVPIARRSIEQALEPTLDRNELSDIQLIVSELVSNSVRHAQRGPEHEVVVHGSVESGTLRIEVKDEGRGFEPDLQRLGADDTGWGLHILDQLVDRWGTTRDPASVWIEMDLPPNRTSPAGEPVAQGDVDSSVSRRIAHERCSEAQ
jgi:serine/threonine-protein kinase RsbW